MRERGVLVALIAAGAGATGSGLLYAQRHPGLTGIFSDLSYRRAGGDLVGMEVFLVAGPGGYFATVQCAAGEPGKPAVVPVQLAGTRLTFRLDVAQPDCAGAFVGTLSRAGIRGRFTGETSDRWLPRRASYWQD